MSAGGGDVCTGSSRRRPGSAGAAGTDGSHRWLAGGDTDTAPPAPQGKEPRQVEVQAFDSFVIDYLAIK